MPVVYNNEYPRRLRAGFIGCGGHAYRNIYPTFQFAPVDLVVVCDLDADRAASYAKVFGRNAITRITGRCWSATNWTSFSS